MAKLTPFQSSVTKEQLIDICSKMHFMLTAEQLEGLQYYFKYTWVCVSFRVKGYGFISFGIDNYHQEQLYGSKVTKEQVKEVLDRGGIGLKIWRFVDDEIYKRQEQAEMIVKSLYQPPTVDEFYADYYKD